MSLFSTRVLQLSGRSIRGASPSVAQALLFTLRNEGPVLLRPLLSLHHHLQSARTVPSGEPPTQ